MSTSDIENLISEVQKLNAEAVTRTLDTATPDAKQNAGQYYYDRYDRLITESLGLVVRFALIPRASLEYTQSDFEEIKSLRDDFKSRILFWRKFSADLAGLAETFPGHNWDALRTQITRLIEQTEVL